MNLGATAHKVLTLPQTMTDAGYTGGWVDVADLVLRRSLKFVLAISNGLTSGNVTGTIQSAPLTDGVGASTVATFSTIGTNGNEAKLGVLAAGHRYVRHLAQVATGKNMIVTCVAFAEARYS